jgi:hypothetical protein
MEKNTIPNPSHNFPQGFAERLLEKAKVYERHQRLGHFHHIDGIQTAAYLRDLAHKIQLEQDKVLNSR